MRGKVKYVTRSVWYVGNQAYQHSSDCHDVRYTNTYAVLYNEDNVSIDEDEIRSCYNRTKITDNLISELSDDLHNVWIEYSADDDGDYWLDDELDDLV
ncbi:hypothetical protein [Bacteroides sp. 224]|uniref:hypothetical protein n=1 Tax=Bacteroides sp. 224 TaxID=2302936 RepID=UPI0013D084E5|nr:hypothetical protein [Bacteroides sp. 224]NDV65930.1 hypothetical protein [Bacteroides sp. 224]